MSRRWLAAVLTLTLTACGGGDPRAELRGDVEAVTLAANGGNPDGVRTAVQDLLDTIRRQVTARELDPGQGKRLEAIALRIRENADLAAPSPSPEPSPTQQESPSPEPPPSPSPEPSPSPSPSPSPEPSEEPAPSEQPQESPPPVIEVSPMLSPAAQQSPPQQQPSSSQVPQSAAQPSPAASATG